MPNMDPITRARRRTTPVITTDRNMRMPVFVLILSRWICLLIFSSMQYRLRFFAIFLSMIVANSKNGVTFAVIKSIKGEVIWQLRPNRRPWCLFFYIIH